MNKLSYVLFLLACTAFLVWADGFDDLEAGIAAHKAATGIRPSGFTQKPLTPESFP
ncbi:MAG: hypothetical protein JW822_13420 [Spirochaetales bacterium]|nr:hypothetical protein [Spirochaetales bacterium]